MIFEKIRTIIAEQLGIEESSITMNTVIREDLSADSLDLFQIINDIEDAFDVKITEVEKIVTVADTVHIVEEQKK